MLRGESLMPDPDTAFHQRQKHEHQCESRRQDVYQATSISVDIVSEVQQDRILTVAA